MADEDRKNPKSVEEQDAPEPERLVTPQEEAGMDIAEMEDPPQAEGSREDEEDDGVGRRAGSGEQR